MPIEPPSAPSAQAIGEYPSATAAATSAKRALAAFTWSASGLFMLLMLAAEAVPIASRGKRARPWAHLSLRTVVSKLIAIAARRRALPDHDHGNERPRVVRTGDAGRRLQR